MNGNILEAKDILNDNSNFDDVIMCIYILIYASENNYQIEKLNDTISNNNFSIANFKIIKGEM